MKLIIRSIAILACTFMAGTVSAGSIDFEEFGPQPGLFVFQEPLDSEYAALGANFSGGWEILNQSGNFGLNARSGEHFAAYNTNIDGITDTLTMAFDNVITQASGFLGAGASSSWTVTALLGGGQVSQLNLLNPAGNYVEFAFSSISFDQITIQGSNFAGVLDDLSFEMSSVPTPGTIALFGLGFAAFGIARRRKA